MTDEEKDLLDFLYRMIEKGTHKIYDYDGYDRKICEYINLIEKQQQEIEYWKEQAEGYSGLAKQIQQDYREMEQEGIIKYE